MIIVKREDKKPNRRFVSTLKAYDSRLCVLWNLRKQRWEIWEKGRRGRASIVFTVQDELAMYLPLDYRVMDRIQKNDVFKMFKSSDPSKIAKLYSERLEQQEYEREANLKKANKNRIIDIAQDTYSNMVGIQQVQSGWDGGTVCHA